MCLYPNEFQTEEKKEFFKKRKREVFYKHMEVVLERRGVCPMFYGPSKVFKGGWYKSDRKTKRYSKRKMIYKGIHVYRRDYSFDYHVKVYGYAEDYIATNEEDTESVFLKVYIPKSEIKRVLKLEKEKRRNQWPHLK